MDMPTRVAKLRFLYHTNMLDVCNVLNQIGILKNDKAEEVMKKHTMTAINDCLPRMGYDISKLTEEESQK